jgi:hypothetical protein
VIGEIAHPQAPGLFAKLAFRWITVLVQRFKIAEHACELFPRDAEFFGIHGSPPLQ